MSAGSIKENLTKVLSQVSRAAMHSGREAKTIQLVAVSKKQSVALMEEYLLAARECGIPAVFGENYMQELASKRACFQDTASFHAIGPLQSNKVRDAVAYSDVIESVHSQSVLHAIAKEARKVGKVQRIFLQVNIAEDSAKKGFAASSVEGVVREAATLRDAIELEGLMTITALYDNGEEAREDFRRMANVRRELEREGCISLFRDSRILLSMGMSADFDVAIEEGADVVRVGTAIFGEREG